MSAPIDFWFDFSSPYSYIASELIDDLAAKYGRAVNWRPMLLGAAFKASGLPLLVTVPLKGEYSLRDFDRSARFHGIPYRLPDAFPVASLAASRGYYWLQDQDPAVAHAFAHAVFRAFWTDNRNIGEQDVVLDIVRELGLDAEAFAAAIATPEVKERLKRETELAVSHGMFGAPYIVVDGEAFWGADRLPQIEKWLATGGF